MPPFFLQLLRVQALKLCLPVQAETLPIKETYGVFGIGIWWMEENVILVMILSIIYDTVVHRLSILLDFKYLYIFNNKHYKQN